MADIFSSVVDVAIACFNSHKPLSMGVDLTIVLTMPIYK